ncbi:hypothetical protein SNEBB_006824 [Seison nebaliae]|nr:hypothetical protein SNEBB_006824 [Seison nebaliae]
MFDLVYINDIYDRTTNGEYNGEWKSAILQSASPDDHCYCKSLRELQAISFQCVTCGKYFHRHCLLNEKLKSINLIPMMSNYEFSCCNCSTKNEETFEHFSPKAEQTVLSVIANLTLTSKTSNFFSQQTIIQFIARNWERMTFNTKKQRLAYFQTNCAKFLSKPNCFLIKTELDTKTEEVLFGLRSRDILYRLGAFTEKICQFFSTNQNSNIIKDEENLFIGRDGIGTKENEMEKICTRNQHLQKTKKIKRRFDDTSIDGTYHRSSNSHSSNNKRVKYTGSLSHEIDTSSQTVPPPILGEFVPTDYPLLDHPFNRENYRYLLAEPDPFSPIRSNWGSTPEYAGKPIPGHLYRLFTHPKSLLALHDRSTQLSLSSDRLTVNGSRGYSTVRANQGVSYGTWYFEFKLKHLPKLKNVTSSYQPSVRVGWSQSYTNVHIPCGCDIFSYGWRSRKGTTFHRSEGYHYPFRNDDQENNNDSSYGDNDICGCLIHLPNRHLKLIEDDHSKNHQIITNFSDVHNVDELREFEKYVGRKQKEKRLTIKQAYKVDNGNRIKRVEVDVKEAPIYDRISEQQIASRYQGKHSEDGNQNNIFTKNEQLLSQLLPPTYKHLNLIKFKSHLYYESRDVLEDIVRSKTIVPDSSIHFFKNGKCLGPAFVQLTSGTYFPTISIYKDAHLNVNFGPNFEYEPDANLFPEWTPMSEAGQVNTIRYLLADLVFHVANPDPPVDVHNDLIDVRPNKSSSNSKTKKNLLSKIKKSKK